MLTSDTRESIGCLVFVVLSAVVLMFVTLALLAPGGAW
jgi:hypothetical protein